MAMLNNLRVFGLEDDFPHLDMAIRCRRTSVNRLPLNLMPALTVSTVSDRPIYRISLVGGLEHEFYFSIYWE